MTRFTALLGLTATILLAGCAGPSYKFHPVPGKTGVVRQGYAFPPADAPSIVEAAITAGNRISGMPYRRGGGHANGYDTGYDCSGSVSYVLREIGELHDSMPSRGFRSYGKPGEGKWISIYAKNGHVFMVVAGVRFDTGYNDVREGPRWSTRPRPANGFVIRHPDGL